MAVRRTGQVVFWALSGLLYLLASACVLLAPLFAARMITLFIAVALGASGLARAAIGAAWSGAGRGWTLVSALASIVASAVIALGWPLDALWVPGLVLAVDLMLQGVMLVLIGLAFRAVRG